MTTISQLKTEGWISRDDTSRPDTTVLTDEEVKNIKEFRLAGVRMTHCFSLGCAFNCKCCCHPYPLGQQIVESCLCQHPEQAHS